MSPRVRIGAVSYLNSLPLVHGLAGGPRGPALELTYATPAALADLLAAGELDVALLPVIELARIPELEIVPGLAIGSRGPCRSVLLVSTRPAEEIKSLALDRDSRTSNALARLLLDQVWQRRPQIVSCAGSLAESLRGAHAAVRIGDKALFEPLPPGARAYDLGEIWTRETSLPFVFAVWAARPGVVDRELYLALHAARRDGSRAIERIAAGYRWNGEGRAEIARDYLTRNIRFRLGSTEIRAMELFFGAAAALGLIEAVPEIRLALERWTACHEAAAQAGRT